MGTKLSLFGSYCFFGKSHVMRHVCLEGLSGEKRVCCESGHDVMMRDERYV